MGLNHPVVRCRGCSTVAITLPPTPDRQRRYALDWTTARALPPAAAAAYHCALDGIRSLVFTVDMVTLFMPLFYNGWIT